MTRVLRFSLAALLIFTASSAAAQSIDVPEMASHEIARRGDFVEPIGPGYGSDLQSTIAEALSPPADDSHKWFITVISTRNCTYCEKLKQDFANSPHLRPFVNAQDHKQSWAHYNVYSAQDQTQAWRWRGIKLGGFPTLIIQPPRDGRYGDPKTVVLQKTGYDGNAKKLAGELRAGIVRYLQTRTPRRGVGDQQPPQTTGDGYTPPFAVPPRPQPVPFAPNNPLDFPPKPVQPPAPSLDLGSLLVKLIGGLLGGGGLTNVLLLVLAAFALIRTFRKATGQKLLLDDEAYEKLVERLKSLVQPQQDGDRSSG